MTGGRLVAAQRLLVEDEVLAPGWLRIADATVVGLGAGEPPGPATTTIDGTVVPGFVDLHCHGGGGHEFTDPDVAHVRAALAFHAARGNAATMLSLVTAPADELLAQVRRLAPLVRAGEAPGIHLEGPWLARSRCGAQDPRYLRPPDPAEIDALLEAGEGTVAMVTIAPELDGALDAIDRLTAAGVVVAIGHTDADYAQTRAAIDRGATVATHLFNGMRPLHHRDPGPVLALLDDERVVVELIGDGVHLDPRLVSSIVSAVGAARAALVSDAMAAAGMPDGSYRLGSLAVTVGDGVARLRDGGAIAGGTGTMADLVERYLVGSPAGDAALRDVVALSSGTPAGVLGRADLGRLTVGSAGAYAVL
ncbi:N-acetylglucosamine-6-phosphate deacetylase [Gordonia crocea]|uniref:N-acetylglucosamine-6-phosphate deacetylase n=1 Tax=Gordonia crocea TaxID=589162 RepID=A0A7M3SUB4_9ACTN|nr:amidohydrolase family protein [Gordonia crocea]GED96238.1 N-acetylglucosamine-6-phosphate deacetylase [Gordonia crocea]